MRACRMCDPDGRRILRPRGTGDAVRAVRPRDPDRRRGHREAEGNRSGGATAGRALVPPRQPGAAARAEIDRVMAALATRRS
jgi:hypothetical protein